MLAFLESKTLLCKQDEKKKQWVAYHLKFYVKQISLRKFWLLEI